MKVELTREDLISLFDQVDIKYKLYDHSGYIQICSLFTDDKKFHLGLSWKTQTFNCFKSGEKGKLIYVISKILKENNLKLSDIIKSHSIPEVKVQQSLAFKQEFPDNSHPIDINNKSRAVQMFRLYLNNRNITDDLIAKFDLHYNITDSMFHNRIIIPYYEGGRLVFWNARDITGKASQKYLYPKQGSKSSFVFNLENCIDKKQLIICEGQFNAMIVDGVAAGGSALSAIQAKQIALCNAAEVIVAFDQDKPGIKGMLEACKTLSNYFKNIQYFRLPNLTKEDFCDWGKEKSKQILFSNLKKYNELSQIEEAASLL